MDGKSRRPPFQERAWEPPGREAWHQVDRNTNRRLANAGKHESGVQRLKVAQIFTTHSAIHAQYLLRCTLSPICPLKTSFFFSMRSPRAVGLPEAATNLYPAAQTASDKTYTLRGKAKEKNHNRRRAFIELQRGELLPLASVIISSVCLLLAPGSVVYTVGR